MRRHPLHNPHPITKRLYLLVGVGFFIVGLGILGVALTPTPDLNSFDARKISSSTKIYDRTGETVLYDLNTDVKRITIPLTEMAEAVKVATIAVEDAEFYQHNGIRISSIIRAFIANLTPGGYTQGGSTITQQVVKLTLLTGERSIVRKVHEWFLALKLEQRYSKDEILELYLNSAPYGGTLYGVEAASRSFFGKSAKELSLPEAAYLAALPQSPTYYSPYGNHKDALEERKNFVLERMKSLGYIDEETYADARNADVVFKPQTNSAIIAPHFVFYVREYLERTYGANVVDQGLSVITTLDTELQAKAEEIVARRAYENAKKYNATNAALIALDPKTGQILSMVGSRNYFDPDIDGNYNATIALRQPGSSFKPVVYAAALSKGYTRDTVIWDVPTQFSTACAPSDVYNNEYPCYAPGNYDDKWRGPMTFTTALAQSINIPAVKVLYLAGIQNVIDLARRAGISSLGKADEYGLSLALGAADMRPLELTNVFAMFANQGVYHETASILRIENKDGAVLEEYKNKRTPVLDPMVANDLTSMLSNNQARLPSYRVDNPLTFPGYDVAAKTGTTNDYRDAWTIGYTPFIAVGVWAGNNDNSPMVKEIAGYIVAPLWHEFMQVALEKFEREYFPEPSTLPDGIPGVLRGEVTAHEVLHYVDRDNPLGGSVGRKGDPQYPAWEYGVSSWLASGFTGQ